VAAKPMCDLTVAPIFGFQDGAQAGVFLMKIYGKTYSVFLVTQSPSTGNLSNLEVPLTARQDGALVRLLVSMSTLMSSIARWLGIGFSLSKIDKETARGVSHIQIRLHRQRLRGNFQSHTRRVFHRCGFSGGPSGKISGGNVCYMLICYHDDTLANWIA
jgi:hypothetical protein